MKKLTLLKGGNNSTLYICCFLFFILLIPFSNFAQNTLVAELTGNPPDFSGWTDTNITTDGEEIILTEASNTEAGAIFFSQPYNLNQCERWRVEFDFRIFDGNGADGLSFWYLENPPTNFVNGASIGLPPNSRGIKVCFDTYDNHGGQFGNNPNPEIQVYYGEGYAENFPEPDMIKEFFGNLRNTDYQRAEISWDNGNIEVVIDGNIVLAGTPQAFDGVENIAEGYFGFSASTGAISDRHSIKNVEVYIDAIQLDSDYEQIVECDQNGDGYADFDLTSAENSFSAIGDFTYYTSISDAGSGQNSIPDSFLNPFTNQTAYQNQIIYVRVENEVGCYVIGELELVLASAPALDSILVSIPGRCDIDHDGYENYDLTQVVDQLIMNPQDYDISYYETQGDANTGDILNSIQNPASYSVNAGATKTIYVRVGTIGDSDCYAVGAIMLQTYMTPEIISAVQLNVCDNNSNDYIFDLTQNTSNVLGNQNPANSTVTYYNTLLDANEATNEITNLTNYQLTIAGCETIYVRIENHAQNQCYETSSFDICVEDVIVGTPVDLQECATADSGLASFDLTINDSNILSGQNPLEYNVEYFLTLSAANNSQDPIQNELNYQAQNPQQTIYVRIENNIDSDCYQVESFVITSVKNEVIGLDSITACENDENTAFDLTEAEDLINLTQNQQIIGYYNTQDNANTNSNPITAASNYVVNNNNETIIIRVQDSQEPCFLLYSLQLVIEDCEKDFFIPNGFSPNADGMNDNFEISGLYENHPNFEIQIFSRNGRKIYEGNNTKDFWDGNSNQGGELPTGTYFYVLNLNDSSSEIIKGWVYLNR